MMLFIVTTRMQHLYMVCFIRVIYDVWMWWLELFLRFCFLTINRMQHDVFVSFGALCIVRGFRRLDFMS